MKEFKFSSKGAGEICAYRWEPEGEVRAVVQILHGVAEYALRYDEFARFLTAKGCLVVAHDHMGHGKSEGCGIPLHFAGGWDAVTEDCHSLFCRTREEFPNVPYILFGHSMGSFLARTVLCRYPELPLRAAVLCGTAWQPAPILLGGRAIGRLEALRLGNTKHSKLMNDLMFGAYNKKIKDAKGPNDWISSTPESVRAYTEDPLCGGEVSIGLANDMLRGLTEIQKKKNLRKMRKDLPILFIAGQDDPVGDMGKGVARAADRFRSCGMQQVELEICKGRHEILLEAHREEVFEILWNFMENQIKM